MMSTEFNKKVMMSLTLFALASAFGDEWQIPSPTEVGNAEAVAALTNALTQAQADDVITLAAGTYDLSSVSMDSAGSNCLYMAKKVTLQGADETSWRETADLDTKTILDGGTAMKRILFIASSVQKPVIRNLTFAHGCLYWSSDDGGKGYGGALNHIGASAANRARVYNCVFRDNVAKRRGGAAYNVEYHDCRIVRCKTLDATGAGGEGCDYYDSLIEGLTNAYSGVRGTIASNCTFRAVKISQWGAATFELTKLYDCDISDCHGSFKIMGLSAGSVVSGCNFHDITYPCDNEYPILSGSFGLVTNCVFANIASRGWGGCIRASSNMFHVVDCVFSNNTSLSWNDTYGVCVCGLKVGTLPTDNPAQMPVLIECTFVGNAFTNTIGNMGAACASVVASNCTFIGNVSRCGGGAVAYGTYVDCTFTGNRATTYSDTRYLHGGGTAAFGSYYNCTFEDSEDQNNGPNIKGCGTVVGADVVSNCVFRDCRSTVCGGAVSNCRLVIDSVISNCYATSTTEGGAAHQSPLVNCTITGEGQDSLYQCVATNCLFYGLTSRDASTHVIFYKSTNVVNCTIADVTDSHCQFIWDGGKDMAMTFKNCIIYNVGGIRGSATNPVRFDHCFYDDMRLAKTTLVDCQVSASSPFVPATNAAYDPATPYAIRNWSKTCGRGMDVGFSATDVDRAGNPRLRGNELDLGCYQCMLPPMGLVLIVR